MPDAKRTSPADPQVLALFQQELARTAAPPGLAAAGPALWPRFAGYYQELARLPRRLRRALQRRWRRSLGGIALLCALGQAPALAATIAVDGTTCTLVDAVTAANNDAPTGGCTAGSGPDTILLGIPTDFPTSLTAVNNNTYGPTGLPAITTDITISGLNSSIARDPIDPSTPKFRILAVGGTGNLTLQNTAVTGGIADSGGGIDNFGTLTLTNSSVFGNTAGSGGGIPFDTTQIGGGGIRNAGTVTISNTRISNNTAQNIASGGGILNFGTVTLTNSYVSGNEASVAGGIRNSGTVTLSSSTVWLNTGKASTGGILNSGTVTLTNSTVSYNTAQSVAFGAGAGGILNVSTMILTNSTVSDNATTDRAAGWTTSALRHLPTAR